MGMAPAAIDIDETYYWNNHTKTISLDLYNHGSNTGTLGVAASKDMVRAALKDHIGHIDVDKCQPGEEDAFYVADIGEVYRQHIRWKMNLGRVKPFYGTLLLAFNSSLSSQLILLQLSNATQT